MTALQGQEREREHGKTDWYEHRGPRPGRCGARGVSDGGDDEDDHGDQEHPLREVGFVQDDVEHEATVDPILGRVKPPPYDDELAPALAMLCCVLVFAIFLVFLLWLNRDVAVQFDPPTSTLPALRA